MYVSPCWPANRGASMCGSQRTSLISALHVFFVLLGGFVRWEVKKGLDNFSKELL